MRVIDESAVRLAVAAPSRLGESPFWHPREQALWWVDIAGRRLHRFDPARHDLRHWDLETEPGCIAPRLDGRLLLAMRDGLFEFDPRRGERRRLAAPPYDPAQERFNDGKCDPQGRFWAATLRDRRDAPAAALYRWTPGGFEREVNGAVVGNGLAWSPSGRTMYWADTAAHTVWAFDVDAGGQTLSRRREFARFAPRDAGQPPQAYGGRPDGAAVDAEGCYWVALYEGARLLRLSPDGEPLLELRLPVRCPTMPCFGGPGLRTLYITTARENRPAAELAAHPLSGFVLAVDVEVPGLPAHLAL